MPYIVLVLDNFALYCSFIRSWTDSLSGLPERAAVMACIFSGDSKQYHDAGISHSSEHQDGCGSESIQIGPDYQSIVGKTGGLGRKTKMDGAR